MLSLRIQSAHADEEKAHWKDQIIRELRPSASFAAFKRWVVRESDTFKTEFAQYI